MVQCVMNNVQTEALWDTGAQVSIVSKDWIAENLPTAESRQMDELLNDKGLDLKVANGTEIPYEGWYVSTLPDLHRSYGYNGYYYRIQCN